MDKLERLLNLTAELLHTDRPISAEEIHRRMAAAYPACKSSFRRSFERDKDDLRALGVPIRVQTVPGTVPTVEGYNIWADEYTGRELSLDPDELAALHLAPNLVRVEGGVGDAFVKLGGIESSRDSGTETTIAPSVGALPFDNPLAVLVEAAVRRHSADFVYNGENRVVEPWRLSFRQGHWYLLGWDRARAAERVFRVDRITGPVTSGDPATRGTPPEAGIGRLLGWELGSGEPVMARVRVDSDQAAWACHVADTEGDPEPDGSVVLTLAVRNTDAFRSFVLSFLDRAEVLEPDSLRDDVIDWLEALAIETDRQ